MKASLNHQPFHKTKAASTRIVRRVRKSLGAMLRKDKPVNAPEHLFPKNLIPEIDRRNINEKNPLGDLLTPPRMFAGGGPGRAKSRGLWRLFMGRGKFSRLEQLGHGKCY